MEISTIPPIPSIPSIPIITTKYKIIHGLRVLEHKLKIQQSLYYNNYDSFLENLIVLEYMTEPTSEPIDKSTSEPTSEPIAKPTDEPTAEPTAKPTSKTINGPIANVLGCWNSECIAHKYLSHKKSFNQPILRDLMNTNNPNFTILLGDNIYERPDDILIKNHFGETKPDEAKAKTKAKTKAKDKTKVKNPPYNYMSLWLNGFACFNKIHHPFFAILGNHDLHPDVMEYQISQTYINNPTIEADGANLILTLNSKWIMPEEFYVLIINGWHLLMLNSNSLYLNELNEPSNIQEHLIKAYLDELDKLASSTTYSKKVIVCLHEPIYAIGHKPKKQIIDNT
jgi:predicted phosphodiesterase